jgi:hypothetical protein
MVGTPKNSATVERPGRMQHVVEWTAPIRAAGAAMRTVEQNAAGAQ